MTSTGSARHQHVLGKIKDTGTAVVQGDQIALQSARMLMMLPRYGIFNEVGMVETRKAICAWLNVPITDEQAADARAVGNYSSRRILTN